jgi:hypothetical protein
MGAIEANLVITRLHWFNNVIYIYLVTSPFRHLQLVHLLVDYVVAAQSIGGATSIEGNKTITRLHRFNNQCITKISMTLAVCNLSTS